MTNPGGRVRFRWGFRFGRQSLSCCCSLGVGSKPSSEVVLHTSFSLVCDGLLGLLCTFYFVFVSGRSLCRVNKYTTEFCPLFAESFIRGFVGSQSSVGIVVCDTYPLHIWEH